MKEVPIVLAIGFIALDLGLGCGYLIGLYIERKKWNQLIDEGILPKPKHPKK